MSFRNSPWGRFGGYYGSLEGGSGFLRHGLSSLAVLLLLRDGLSTNGGNMTVLQTFATLVGKTVSAFSFAFAGIKCGAIFYTLIVVRVVPILILL